MRVSYLLQILTAGAIAVTSIARAADTPRPVSIPPGNLQNALTLLMKQTGVELVYRPEQVTGLKTQGAQGNLSPDGALAALLEGTSLAVEKDSSGVTLILPLEPSASPSTTPQRNSDSRPPQRFRLAEVDQAPDRTPLGQQPSSDISHEPLQEVVVTGRYEFLSADTSGTTNLPLPIEQVPQSISLVSNDFIKAADLKTLGEIAEYTPGAVNVGNPESSGSAIKLRGFTPGRTVDGINVTQAFVYYEPDYAIFDRLEVVKGPSSVVYGVSSPGGTVNYVTKSATSQTPDYLFAQAGSWNNYRVEGQIAGALDTEGRVRAIGIAVYDRGDSFVHDLTHEKISAYGGINVDFSDSVTAFIHGGYERFSRPTYDGTPPEADNSPAPVPISFFIGSKNIIDKTSVYHAEGDLTWHATDMLELNLRGNYERSDSNGGETYSCCLDSNGNIALTSGLLNPWLSDNYGIGASSVYKLDKVGLKGSFISVAALYQNSHFDGNDPYNSGTANLADGEAAIWRAFEALLAGPLTPYDVRFNSSVLTISGQSVLQLVDPVSLLLGVSYSKPGVTAITNGVEQGSSKEGQVSYRGGITYEFLSGVNAYVSYSESFTPQPRQTVDLQILPPLTGKQYEAGVKYRSGNGHLLMTGAVFQIDEKDLQTYAQTVGDVDYYSVIPEITHKGFELQAIGQITAAWQINAGYAYLDPKITRDDGNPASVGKTELFLPKQTFSTYTTYSLNDGIFRGLSIGGGVRYVSDQRTSYDGSSRNIPSYALADLTASYSLNKWLVQLNAHNIFDRRYYFNDYQTLIYGNFPGDPRNFALSVRRTF